jgi:hypothetical protein
MIQPIELELEGKTYILSKFPAVAGREIIAKYPVANMPKLGEYGVSEETMLKLMSFVWVKTDGEPIKLATKALVDNHVPSWEVLAKLEWSMMEYNCSFFQNGKVSTFLEGITAKLPQLITKMLTDSLGQLSAKEKPASKS